MRIPRSAFFPQPAVDSVCVQLAAREAPPVALENERGFFELIKAAFAHRRKSLINCLDTPSTGRASREGLEGLLQDLGLTASVRGETLSLEQFAQVSNALHRLSRSF